MDLDRNVKPDVRGFNDMRFRLDPTFYISDVLRVKTSLNFMDDVFGACCLKIGQIIWWFGLTV